MSYERRFKKMHPRAKINPGANLPLLSKWSKLKLHPGVIFDKMTAMRT